jgi:LCP family protein required for cell wall assembly
MKKPLLILLALALMLPFAPAGAADLPTDEGLYHLLLLGIDTRDPENWDGSRTDTIIVVSVDKAGNELMLTSIMRDTYVSIPGKGSGRINAAYAYGGAALAMDTIEANLGLAVDGYAVFDFTAVRKIVDSIGGIEITMNAAEVKVMNAAFSGADFAVGQNHLDADQTLHFCRIRKGVGDDFERTRRQRDVLRELFSRIPSLGVDGLLALIDERASMIETSIDPLDFIGWGMLLYQMRDAQLEDLRIPIDGGYSNKTIHGASVLQPNLAKNTDALSRFLSGDTGVVSLSAILRAGSSGDQVRALQEELIALGYHAGEASGVYDDATVDSVRAFQKANGLSADGIAGPDTLGAMYGSW